MNSVRKVYHYAEPNLTVIGWMGFLGYPAYYYVWTYLFPQPYESLSLRVFCSIIFAVVALRRYLPSYLQRYLPMYFAYCIPICLPFFFSYMMFKNDWSEVWVMSFMASILIHVLLVYRTGLMLLQTCVAVAASVLLVYGANLEAIKQHVVWAYVPIFAFTYIFGNLFYLRSQTEHESKVSLAKSFGAGIAHEMRNPLSALKASIDVLEGLLPKPPQNLETPDKNERNLCFDADSLKLANEVLQQANQAIDSGTETIDLLLTSIDQNRITNATYRKHSIKEVVEQALQSFPYSNWTDAACINVKLDHDYSFFGSDTLVKYTLYNLLKNAFFHGRRENFTITIELKRFNSFNQLVLSDSGVGMRSDVCKRIFEDFYTQGKMGGYGIGLPFCMKVMQAMGGNIRCRSELNKFTEFTLTFPPYSSSAVKNIKLDMMKSKSLLYIGEFNSLLRVLEENAFYQGFNLTQLRLNKALVREEYEFEFDVIVVDLNQKMVNQSTFKELEAKLSFTQGRIVYLYDKYSVYSYELERSVDFYPVEKCKFLSQSRRILDDLCFDSPKTSRKLDTGLSDYQGKTLIIADDNHSIRAYTAILMKKFGFTVMEAQNGQEVLDILAQSPIDLIVMDVEMPIMNGISAAKVIRSQDSAFVSIPIVGYTGDSSSDMAEQIYRAGINDYVIKPADSDKLISKIAQWL